MQEVDQDTEIQTKQSPPWVLDEQDLRGKGSDGPPKKGRNRFASLLLLGGIGGIGFCSCSVLLSFSDPEWLDFFVSIFESLKWQVAITGIFLTVYWAVVWGLLVESLDRLLTGATLGGLVRSVASLRQWVLTHRRQVSRLGLIISCTLALVSLSIALNRRPDVYNWINQFVLGIIVNLITESWSESAKERQLHQDKASLGSGVQLVTVLFFLIAVAFSSLLFDYLGSFRSP